MKNKKKAFTLVELLAVIVILAIILVIAIPQIIKTIKASKLSAMESSAKLIATEADKDFLSQLTLNQYYSAESIACTDVAKLSDDYESCDIVYDENGVATVTLVGAIGRKFAGITCTGTKDNMVCTEGEIEDLPTIMAWTSTSDTDFHKSNIRTTITEIEFVDLKNVTAPTVNNTTSWDVSEAKDNSVIAWLDGTKLYIGGKGGVKANTDSSDIFFNFSSVTNINFNNKFYTSDAQTMQSMFFMAEGTNPKLETIIFGKKFDTSKVENMEAMFWGNTSLKSLDLTGFDTSNVTNMAHMMPRLSLEFLDLSSFDTRKVTDTQYMLADCLNLTTIYTSDNFNLNNVTNSTGMFERDTKLIGGNGSVYSSSYTDKTYAKIDKVGQKGYFTDKKQNLLENNIELEYIESTGTQYIDTEYMINENFKYKIKTAITDTRTSTTIYPQLMTALTLANSSDGKSYRIEYSPSTKKINGMGVSIDYNSNEIYTIEYKLGYTTINGVLYNNNITWKGEPYSTVILLCAKSSNYGIGTSFYSVARIYSAQIYNGDTLVRDYIPVHNTILDTYGLYDKVEGKFYANSGTGNFIPGPEV